MLYILKIKLFRSINFCSKCNFLSNKQTFLNSDRFRFHHFITDEVIVWPISLYLLNTWFSDISCDMFLNQFLMLFRMVQKIFHILAKNIFLLQGGKITDVSKIAIFTVASLKKIFPYTTRGMCAKFQSCYTKYTIVSLKRLIYLSCRAFF